LGGNAKKKWGGEKNSGSSNGGVGTAPADHLRCGHKIKSKRGPGKEKHWKGGGSGVRWTSQNFIVDRKSCLLVKLAGTNEEENGRKEREKTPCRETGKDPNSTTNFLGFGKNRSGGLTKVLVGGKEKSKTSQNNNKKGNIGLSKTRNTRVSKKHWGVWKPREGLGED